MQDSLYVLESKGSVLTQLNFSKLWLEQEEILLFPLRIETWKKHDIYVPTAEICFLADLKYIYFRILKINSTLKKSTDETNVIRKYLVQKLKSQFCNKRMQIICVAHQGMQVWEVAVRIWLLQCASEWCRREGNNFLLVSQLEKLFF